MNHETEKTEELMKQYKNEPGKEGLRILIDQVRKTVFLVPAMLPADVDKEVIKKQAADNPGEQITLPDDIRPIPCILKNKDGDSFLPVYTSPGQIPKEPAYDLIMNVPFRGCYLLALNDNLGVSGVVLNPFTENLLFNKDLLGAIQKEEEAQTEGAKQVQLTPQQYQIMTRQKAEFHDFPLRIFKEGAELIEQISEEGEELLNQIYQDSYPEAKLYEFNPSDFAVMALNINEDLHLVRLDLPEIKVPAQLCHRIYLTLNPGSGLIHYFTIEAGPEKGQRLIGGIDQEGKHLSYGDAPVEGAEISRIMELLEEMKVS